MLRRKWFTPSLNFHDTMKTTDRNAHRNDEATHTPTGRRGFSSPKCRLHGSTYMMFILLCPRNYCAEGFLLGGTSWRLSLQDWNSITCAMLVLWRRICYPFSRPRKATIDSWRLGRLCLQSPPLLLHPFHFMLQEYITRKRRALGQSYLTSLFPPIPLINVHWGRTTE